MSKKSPLLALILIFISVICIIVAVGLIFIKPNTQPVTLDSKLLKIGVVTTPLNNLESYNKLGAYLKKNLTNTDGKPLIFDNQVVSVADNIEEIKIIQNGAFDLITKKIKNKEWDIAFLVEPLLANEAINQDYRFVAPMFPSYSLRTALITNSNGCIKSFDDLYRDLNETKCLNNRRLEIGYKSLGLFYMPIFDLISAKFAKFEPSEDINSVDKILGDVEKDTQGNLVGAVLYLPQVVKSEQNGKIRVLSLSRLMPNGSVLISPNISTKIQNKLTTVLLDASEELKKITAYGDGNMPDYQLARGIKKRAEELWECSQKEQSQKNSSFTFNDCQIQSYDGEINGLKIFNPTSSRSSIIEFIVKKESNELIVRIPYEILTKVLRIDISKGIAQSLIGSGKYSKVSLRNLEGDNFIKNSDDSISYIQISNASQIKFD
jgi:hypothetical protein